ncbi:MAG TPA: cytochrome c peroxidase [Bryobacteraceae bacterium]|nr:cytochrome c peroxidase [Bryobacteraceae bacterium]
MIRKTSLLAALPLALVLLKAPAQEGCCGPGGMRGGMMGGMPGGMMAPLPAAVNSQTNPITDAKISLGRMLFYDARLSKGGDVSCNSCHNLSHYGVDGKRVSTGYKGQLGGRNSPTVYNAAGHIAQFWDGRAVDVEEQAKGPVLNPVEMAMASELEVVARLKSIPGYRPAFAKAFPDCAEPITLDNMALAIGAFERKLLTPSRWDRFLNGDRSAITAEEMAGHHEFRHNGCITCHNGPYIGGRAFQKLGAEKAWPNETDLGRAQVTKSATDRMVFKVPSLRNVEKTGPYFHDGNVATLDQAIRLMGEYQLGTTLEDQQVTRIAAWLKTLTGEIPVEYVRAPVLPE